MLSKLDKSLQIFFLLKSSLAGLQAQQTNICALKGSSVHLNCSNKHPTSVKNWYTVHWSGNKFVRSNLSADEPRVMYTSQQSFPTLTINDLRDTDRNTYCCSSVTEAPQDCWKHAVVPSTEGQTVSLMCSSSCLLTENPAAYIWYKNGDFLYEDWSPWYQELVSSDSAVSYSCAIRGYQDLRAPPVSVVKVTPSPEVTEGQRVTLTCSTSCPLTHNSNYMWFFKGEPLNSNNKHLILEAFSHQHAGSYSCAVRTGSNITDRSAVKTLKVQSVTIMWEVVIAGVSAVLLLFILLSVIVRKKKTSSQSSGIEMSKNTQQVRNRMVLLFYSKFIFLLCSSVP
uniref:Ig-like domain-containing protein n=1 Tax=Salarias fasciatus TaxID=181472 RepID=A0A672FWZ2_SALFA